MCLLVVLHRVTDGAPLVVAANREEFYARGGEPPRPLGGVPAAAGGVDPAHGGTWLGVNAHGLVVAVTNRRKSNPPGAPRSRGLLARDLLASGSAEEAASQAAAALEAGTYAGCNFLCADGQDCLVLHAGDSLQEQRLPPGLHVLANRDVNDPADRRVRQATDWLASRPLGTSAEALATLPLLCASPEVCFRLADRGTVSSSLLALPARLEGGTYLHAQGPPDVTPYADVSHLLRKLRG
ncbi:MAG: NRDE family protein [Gemmataceae bacterium]